MEFQSYQVLEKAKVELLPILTLPFSELFKKLKSCLRVKQGIRNKYKISLKQAVHHTLFIECQRAIRDYPSEFERNMSTKKDHYQRLQSVTIKFHHKGSFSFHVGKVLKDVKNFIEQSVSGHKIKVSFSEEKPFTLTFNVKKKLLHINGFFILRNRYGNEFATSQFMNIYKKLGILDILLILMVYIYVGNTILIYTIWF